jgi:hypothetical protein
VLTKHKRTETDELHSLNPYLQKGFITRELNLAPLRHSVRAHLGGITLEPFAANFGFYDIFPEDICQEDISRGEIFPDFIFPDVTWPEDICPQVQLPLKTFVRVSYARIRANILRANVFRANVIEL